MIPEDRRPWYLVAVIVALALAIGAAIYFNVREPPAKPRDYGTVPFVPAESHYSTHRVAP